MEDDFWLALSDVESENADALLLEDEQDTCGALCLLGRGKAKTEEHSLATMHQRVKTDLAFTD